MSRVSEIRYVGYAVPDLAAERAFYAGHWGLKPVNEADGMAYFATEASAELYVVRLRQAPQARIDVIALAADTRADVDQLHRKVQAAGCRIVFTPRPLTSFGGGYGFRFFSPDGLPFEISSDVQHGSGRALKPREALPARISHIVLHSPDHQAATRFFIEVLGFRLSDWLGDFMSFLRCNEWHHRIAILPGPPCLNHVAYDMPNLDEMMRGIAKLKSQGIDVRWGPGRHTAGNNTFSYYVTPNGCTVEYTAELERIDEATWQPTVFAPSPAIMDQWGIGVGGPKTMPPPAPDAGLFQPAEV
ncbi:MAG TPA: VOC family protein [Candidatus Acidoferrum sp.]|nr:VOC family protein [Candidatus Acidoferrum sp.]